MFCRMMKLNLLNITALVFLIFLPVIAVLPSQMHRFDEGNAYLSVSRGEYAQAVGFLEQSIEQGDIRSNIHLANLHRLGLGVPIDHVKAAAMYWEGAHRGDPSSMVNLALMYRQGLGVEQDPDVAYGWLELARQYHEPAGQLYMSEMLRNHEVRISAVPALKKRFPTIESLPSITAVHTPISE